MNIDIEPYDTITADQIEPGDQIIVDGDFVERVAVHESDVDIDEIIVTGFSYESGDAVTYSLPFDYEVGLWAV